MELNEQANQPTDEIVDVDYMGGTFQTSKSNLQNPEAMNKLIEAYRNSDDFKEYTESVEFYQNLDKSGAPAGLRSLVDSRPNQESKLATLRKYYPTAVQFDNDNFAYIDPETKKTTIYNPEGVDWGDVSGFGREIAQFGGGVLGGIAGFVSPAVGGAYVGAAAGSTTAGMLYDTYVESAGWAVDNRTTDERLFDSAMNFGVEAIAGKVGDVALQQGVKLFKKGLGGGTKKTEKTLDELTERDITPTAGIVTAGKTAGKIQTALDGMLFTDSIKQQADQVKIGMTNAVKNISDKIAPEKTNEQIGIIIQKGVKDAIKTFRNQQNKLEIDFGTKLQSSNQASNELYRGEHYIANPFENPDRISRLDNLTKTLTNESLLPDDFYSSNGINYYTDNSSISINSWHLINKFKGNPERKVTIYRAVPDDDNITKINNGDWITLSKEYAQIHAYDIVNNEDGKILSMQVKVKDIYWDGNDVNEMAYFNNSKASNEIDNTIQYTNDNLKKLYNDMINDASLSSGIASDLAEPISRLQKILFDPKTNNMYETISYEAMRKERSSIGAKISDIGNFTQGSIREYSKMYRAMAIDMNQNAERLGLKKEWNDINKFTREWMKNYEDLFDKLSKYDEPEKLIGQLLNGSKFGATRLKKIKSELTKDEFNQVISHQWRQLGYSKGGDLEMKEFSPTKFISGWQAIEPTAKDVLFGKNTPLRQDMDKIYNLFEKIVANVKLGNPPKTAANLFAMQTIANLAIRPITTAIGSIMIPWAGAKLITNPKFIRWLAQSHQILDNSASKTTNISKIIQQRYGQLIAIANDNPEISEEIRQFLLSLTANDGNKE